MTLGLVATALWVPVGLTAQSSEVTSAVQVSAPRVEAVTFHNGSVTLAGTLYLPNQAARAPAMVEYHDASGPLRSFPAYQHLANRLPHIGVAVLLFDRRGSGESGGNFLTASFRDLASDGLEAVAYLKTRADIDPRRIGVWGLSQGGWIAPLAASLSPDVAFVVAVSASGVSPAAQMDFAAATALRASGQPASVVDRVLRIRSELNAYYRGQADARPVRLAVDSIRGESWFSQAFLPNSGNFPADPRQTKWYLEMDYDPLPVLARVHVPMAFFFAESDRWTPVDESITKTRQATGSNPNVFIARIAGADHRMQTGAPDSGGPTSADYVKNLEAWLRKVLHL
jgi:uncharacterized protein